MKIIDQIREEFAEWFPPAAVAAPVEPAPPAVVLPDLPGLADALTAANPTADHAIWLPALIPPMIAAQITTPRRIAAFVGQITIEAGAGFREIVENLNYTHADRIVAIFPREVPDLASAAPLVGNPEHLANRVYAGRLGNGDEASGDGWRFRGRGLIQITGRDEYSLFAGSVAMTPEYASAYAETPAGAAASACWYWTTHSLNAFADAWNVNAVTYRVNGSAMVAHAERQTASDAALKVMTA